MVWIRIGTAADFPPGELHVRHLLGRPIGIRQSGDGTISALELACRHQGADAASHFLQGVASRVAESLPPGESPDRAGLGQYLGRLLPPTDFMRFGSIHVTANLRGAIVSIGGERRGTTPLAPVLVRAPATYPVRVEKAGFVPFAASIQVQPDGEVAVAAELARRGAAPPWYQRWWVVAIAGAAVAGATGATIYAVTRDDDSAPVTGTIE